MIRLGSNDVRVHCALPWAVYDQHGRLLLNRGEIIPSEHALGVLLERGMYREMTADEPQSNDDPAAGHPATWVPFEILGELITRLPHIFAGLVRGRPESPQRALRFVNDLQSLCSQDPDAALGVVALCHDAPYPLIHPIHTAILCELMGRHCGLDDDRRAFMLAAALTANVGMHELQTSIHTQREPLTPAQRAELHHHPKEGVALLRAAGISDTEWVAAVLQHHERIDGSGYPEGLKQSAISLEARILALADGYSAMLIERGDRPSMLATEALRELFLARGKAFDEELCSAFIKELGIFPPGAFVRLSNGEVAVVIKRGKTTRTPLVVSVLSPRGGALARPVRRDTSIESFTIADACPRDDTLALNLPALWGYT